MNKILTVGVALAAIAAIGYLMRAPSGTAPPAPATPTLPALSEDGRNALATFAGGCFWCVEADFEKVPGVIEAISGYTGGETADPSYQQVSGGGTGHLEAVLVRFDPAVISYDGLLQAFWRMIDPTDASGQFVDRGQQYATAIFHHDEDQRRRAEQSLAELADSGRYDSPIVTPVRPMGVFYPAEGYHQDYYARNALRYKFYRYNSGRDRYLERTWGEAIVVDYADYPPIVPAD